MLTVKDTMTLDFEAHYAVTSAASNARKEIQIREVFTESATTYYQRLNRLLENPDALAYAPMLIRRLRRLRDARRSQRATAARLTAD